MTNLIILCGGQSPEHEISIRSTKNILKALDQSRYKVTIIGISKEGSWRLLDDLSQLDETLDSVGKEVTIIPGSNEPFFCNGESLGVVDVIFPVLHGPNGEDGTIQGLLSLLRIPFVGPGVLGSSASMDKDVTKRLLRDSRINVADWILLRRGDEIPKFSIVESELGSVVFVKPANMGSSVGVHRVTNSKEWKDAIEDAFTYDRKVLVERLVEGKELECAVLGNETPMASGVGEVQSGNFYSYEEKYDSSSVAEIQIPAKIDEKYLIDLKDTAIRAYQSLDCEGMSRVDMFLTESGDIYVNEINTIPGFTNISMYPKLWEQEGMSYADLLDRLIELAMNRD